MDDSEEEEEEEEVFIPPIPVDVPKPSPVKSRKAQNKTKKNKRKKNNKKAAKISHEDDILNQAIKEVALQYVLLGNDPSKECNWLIRDGYRAEIIPQKEESPILAVDTKYLLASNEVKRMFGSDALGEPEKYVKCIS